jgi:hypothetical protein
MHGDLIQAAMKKPLLKPPPEDREFMFLPGVGPFSDALHLARRVATCHQLVFFHPGIAVRFHLINALAGGIGRLVFMDTDRTKLEARIPCPGERTRVFSLVSSDRPLCQGLSVGEEELKRFFLQVGEELVHCVGEPPARAYARYVQILTAQDREIPFRERLAESFVRYSGIDIPYVFISDLLAGDEFRDFFQRILCDAQRFRDVYNRALDWYGKMFRFRYRNFPFPRLKGGELPFWVLGKRGRSQFDADRFDVRDIRRFTLLPKASPLTLFLRLYHCDLFVHGVGGGNYEWVNDRIAEEFFGVELRPFFVLSATFNLNEIPERDFPFFLIAPEELKNRLRAYLIKSGMVASWFV